MNNQAAQTMPELPVPWQCETAMCPDLYTADKMHQYAREYAASQAAWVPSPSNWITAMLATLPTAIMTDEKVRHIESEAYRAMERDAHRKAAAPAAQQTAGVVLARGWFHALPDEDDYEFHDDASGAGKNCDGCIRAMIVAAPAASGGDEPDPLVIAKELATSIWSAHYREDSPNWEPFDNLAYVLSQISNMVSGMTRIIEPPAAASVGGVHPDALPDGTLSKSTAKRVETLAASGVDISHVTIDFPQVGTAGPFKVIDGRMTLPDVTMNDLIHHARMGYVPASNYPAAASVSERARELLAQACGVSPEAIGEYSDRDVMVRQALVAVESALTTVAAGDGETIDCEVAVAPASIFGIGVKLSTVVGAIRMRSSMEGTYAFTNKVREATSRPDTGGHALPGDDCPLCKAVGGLTDLRHGDGGHKRIHCAKCGKGSFGLHPIPGSTTDHPDALEQALTQQWEGIPQPQAAAGGVDALLVGDMLYRINSYCLTGGLSDADFRSNAEPILEDIRGYLSWAGYEIQPEQIGTTPQPSADAVRELVNRWRDAGNACVEAGSIEGALANNACADELESLLSGGSNA